MRYIVNNNFYYPYLSALMMMRLEISGERRTAWLQRAICIRFNCTVSEIEQYMIDRVVKDYRLTNSNNN